jgi:hypothetical protein
LNARPVLALFLVTAGLGLVGCGIGDAQTHLRTAVDAKREELNRCYADTLTRDASAAGSMHLWVHVESDQGRVDNVEVANSDIQDQTLNTCVSSTLQGIQLDEAPSAQLRVEYTLLFQPEGPPPAAQAPGSSQPPPPAQGAM